MKSHLLAAAAILGAATAMPVESPAADRMHPMTSREAKLPVEGMLASLSGATAWLNSQPLMAEGLRGKVVSSTSGPTPASTGSVRNRMFAIGRKSTRIRDWW
jgi:hypothetical protein